jgi:cell wall-associated NlpC family hydrolase
MASDIRSVLAGIAGLSMLQLATSAAGKGPAALADIAQWPAGVLNWWLSPGVPAIPQTSASKTQQASVSSYVQSGASSASTSPAVSGGGASVAGRSIASYAMQFIGKPYVYGGTSPTGWDCSGFVQYVLQHLGVSSVPRTSEQQWAWVQQIPRSALQAGDLVFAQFPGDNSSPGHVGIYVGGGQVLSAEDPAQGTGVSSLASWGSAIVGYGRIPGSSNGGTVLL